MRIAIVLFLFCFSSYGQGLANLQAQRLAGATPSYDTDAQAFIDAVGTLTGAEETAIDDLVVGLKADGVWTKLHALYPIIGGTAAEHKWNLVNPTDSDVAFRLTFGIGITHSSNGIQGDKTADGYANTHFVPNAHVTQNNVCFGVYSTIQGGDNGREIMGGSNGSSQQWVVEDRDGGNGPRVVIDDLDEAVVDTGGIVDGLIAANRDSSTNAELWVNGTELATNASANTGSNPNYSIYLGATNFRDASLTNPSDVTIGLAFICTEALTATELGDMYTTIEAYQDALSRGVNP